LETAGYILQNTYDLDINLIFRNVAENDFGRYRAHIDNGVGDGLDVDFDLIQTGNVTVSNNRCILLI